MVKSKILLQMDGIIVVLQWVQSKEHKVYDQIQVPSIVQISGENIISWYRQFQMKSICNVDKSILV